MKKILLAIAMTGLTAMAQSVISAKAGVVHYTEGDVQMNDQPLVMKPNKFPELKNTEVLRTTEGRAEVLLAPGTFLRLSDNSAIKMESNSILATRVAILEGTAIVEVAEIGKLSSIEFTMGADTVSIRKPGLYRLEMDSPSVKVYSGEVAVNFNNELLKVTEGRQMSLTGEHLSAKFDKKSNTDEIVQWADRRASTLAMANIHSAKTVANGLASSQKLGASGWLYNSYYGMMTYVPYGRGFMSPFGYTYFSPSSVYAVYYPQTYYSNGGGNYGAGAYGGGRGQVGFDSGLGYNTSPMRSSTGYSGGGGVSGGGAVGASGGGTVSGGERAGGAAAAGGARSGGGGGRAQ